MLPAEGEGDVEPKVPLEEKYCQDPFAEGVACMGVAFMGEACMGVVFKGCRATEACGVVGKEREEGLKLADNAEPEGVTQTKGEALDWEEVLTPKVDGNKGERVLNGLTSMAPTFSLVEYWVLLV